MDKQLRQLREFLDFYFAPWGAAKGEIWEDLFDTWEVNPQSAYLLSSRILTGEIVFSVDEIKMLQIVSGRTPA